MADEITLTGLLDPLIPDVVAPAVDTKLYCVTDPSGTPADGRVSLSELLGSAGDWKADGSVVATGDFDLGGFAVANVGLVDGVDLSALSSAFIAHAADGSIHYADAPADAQEYVRKDNAWAVASGGAGTLLADGSVPLTANWGVGGFDLTGLVNLGGASGLQVRMTAAGVRIETGISGDPAYLLQVAAAGGGTTLALVVDDTSGHTGMGMAPSASFGLSLDAGAQNAMQVVDLASGGWAYKFEGGTSGDSGLLMNSSSGTQMLLRQSGGIVHQLKSTATSFLCNFASTELIVGTSSHAEGRLQVQQEAARAEPVLRLEQLTVTQPFTRLVGESHVSDDSQSFIDAADLTTPGAIVGWERVYIEDTQASGPITNGIAVRPLYALPTA